MIVLLQSQYCANAHQSFNHILKKRSSEKRETESEREVKKVNLGSCDFTQVVMALMGPVYIL